MKNTYILTTLLLASMLILAGCSQNTEQTTTTAQTQSSTQSAISGSSAAASSSTESSSTIDTSTVDISSITLASTHSEGHSYAIEESEAVQVTLSENSASASSTSVDTSTQDIIISAGGTYEFTGDYSGGSVIVRSNDEEPVQLLLNNATIENELGPAIYVEQAEETVLYLVEGTSNSLRDGSNYDDTSEDAPSSTIDSHDDLTILGTGSLEVEGNNNDAISTNDGLVIEDATIVVTAKDDGIRGKNYIALENANIAVESGGDGLKSDNEDSDQGYISITGGTLEVESDGDAVNGETAVVVYSGSIDLTSGGGANSTTSEDSAKGIKSSQYIHVLGGTITVDSADDAIHSNNTIAIDGGTITVASGDDGIHADDTVTLNSGTVSITDSYEGVEAAHIHIGGDVELEIHSSDDGINVASGNDGSGFGAGPGRPGGAQDQFLTSSDGGLEIDGGYVAVYANGDGIDVNGSVEMSDGVVIVHGPSADMNGALDYDAGFTHTGGTLVAIGSSGMAQAPSSATQAGLLINFTSAYDAGDLIHVESDNADILTVAAAHDFQSVYVSTADMQEGETVDVYVGGSASGSEKDGVYTSGYSGGDLYASVDLDSTITTEGQTGGFGGGRGGRAMF